MEELEPRIVGSDFLKVMKFSGVGGSEKSFYLKMFKTIIL